MSDTKLFFSSRMLKKLYIKILLNYFYIHDFAFIRFYSLQANPENFPRERKGTKLKIDRGIENTDFYWFTILVNDGVEY